MPFSAQYLRKLSHDAEKKQRETNLPLSEMAGCDGRQFLAQNGCHLSKCSMVPPTLPCYHLVNTDGTIYYLDIFLPIDNYLVNRLSSLFRWIVEVGRLY